MSELTQEEKNIVAEVLTQLTMKPGQSELMKKVEVIIGKLVKKEVEVEEVK